MLKARYFPFSKVNTFLKERKEALFLLFLSPVMTAASAGTGRFVMPKQASFVWQAVPATVPQCHSATVPHVLPPATRQQENLAPIRSIHHYALKAFTRSIDIDAFWYFVTFFSTCWYVVILLWESARRIPICPESFCTALFFIFVGTYIFCGNCWHFLARIISPERFH